MRNFLILGAVGVALALQGCDRAAEEPSEAPAETAAAPATEPMADTAVPAAEGAAQPEGPGPHTGTGKIAAVSGQDVTIAHQAVEALGWPAMTMTFRAPDASMVQGLQPGTAVRFSFRKEGETYVLTEIARS